MPKADNVLQLLTKYLLQYRKVSIPHVGTFEIVQQPAQMNFVDKLLLPPTFATEIRKDDAVSDHQLSYLSSVTQSDTDTVRQELDAFGKNLHDRISFDKFSWNGIGVIENGHTYDFQTSLRPISAEKVQRENIEHTILVGDKEITTLQQVIETVTEQPNKKRSVGVIIGWIVLLLSIAYIVYLVYIGGFSVSASGLETAP